MIRLTDYGFYNSYDIDGMLYDNAVWLSMQVGESVKDFTKTASQLDLRQSDWDLFWKKVRNYSREVKDIECLIGEKRRLITREELEVLEQILLSKPTVISKCCEAEVKEGICSDCGRRCNKVYVF